MAYHDDLLRQALELAHRGPNATQADVRRSVSAAYYALFHLLISETVAHWRLDSSRDGLARMFEHSVMKRASSRVVDAKVFPYRGEDQQTVQKLRAVATTFVRLQDNRHTADYDNSVRWTQTEALKEVRIAAEAFQLWESVKGAKIAQDYLVSLLIKPRA